MRLSVRGSKLRVSTRLRTYAERRVRFALSRFGTRVTRVQVSLARRAGPRGGGDRSCTVVVSLPGADPLIAEHCDRRMTLAVDHAVARAARHVARTLELLDGRLAAPRN